MSKRRRRMSGLLALAALVAVVVTAAGIFPFRQIIADRRTVSLAQEKLLALRGENSRLEDEVVALGSDAEVERLAREQLGLVFPGETAYVVVAPEGEEAPAAEVEPTLDRPGEQPWWRDVWNFLTGGDLVRDG
ncbi:MAG TPA: septum formation initiator family protein [Acidimicrobiia bacterium]|nr:septum formation initiator family protein [Acidimicrobiia bacterium]